MVPDIFFSCANRGKAETYMCHLHFFMCQLHFLCATCIFMCHLHFLWCWFNFKKNYWNNQILKKMQVAQKKCKWHIKNASAHTSKNFFEPLAFFYLPNAFFHVPLAFFVCWFHYFNNKIVNEINTAKKMQVAHKKCKWHIKNASGT